MSMEMRVFFAGELPTPAVLNAAMQALGLEVSVGDEEIPLDRYRGFMPMAYGAGEDADESGSEVYVGVASEAIADLGITGVDPALDREVSFRWGGDLMECACANAVAAAIARITGGTIYDDEAGAPISIDAAVTNVRSCISMMRKSGA